MTRVIIIIEIIATLGAACSIAYYLLCLYSAAVFLRQKAAGEDARPTPTRFTPPVSILKPLKGMDPEMYESLRSHCVQDYPEHEIIFGVSNAHDPAVELVRRLQAEFPQHAIRLLVCEQVLGVNIKVSNLAQMLSQADHEYLIVNDSDIRVGPDYLQRVVAPLADAKVGMVTCLYRGVAAHTLGSRLESLGISTDFSLGVLVARLVQGIRFGLGSTLAFRRRDLEGIGGFEAVLDYLADDYEIGHRMAERGLEVKLSDVVVDTYLPPYTLGQFFKHQLRWARTVRNSRPWGYAGMVLTFGLPWALLALVSSHGALWAWELAGITLALRVAVALVVGRLVLRDRHVTALLWLGPLRDMIALLVWIASFAGQRVAWRGDTFTLKDGKLARIS